MQFDRKLHELTKTSKYMQLCILWRDWYQIIQCNKIKSSAINVLYTSFYQTSFPIEELYPWIAWLGQSTISSKTIKDYSIWQKKYQNSRTRQNGKKHEQQPTRITYHWLVVNLKTFVICQNSSHCTRITLPCIIPGKN